MELSEVNKLFEDFIKEEEEYAEIEYKDALKNLTYIAFNKLYVYKPTTVKYAKQLMNIAISKDLAYPYNFGKGKGKYKTKEGLSIDDVINGLEPLDEVKTLINKYINYLKKLQANRIR